MRVEAKLVAYTQPCEDIPADTPESLIAYCARVSSSREETTWGEDYEGLLKYCIRNKHWSVFEMADAVVSIKAPRDITRQLLRHRSFSFQEFSQRYSDEIEFTEREFRRQDDKNRQNSVDDLSDYTKETMEAELKFSKSVAEQVYNNARSHGVAKECARVFLPEGLTMSHLFSKGSFRSWLHYLDVRDDPGVTQWEHVLLAREVKKVLQPIMPNILGIT